MTQNRFKYDSRSAGDTLFKPQAESKKFDPYRIPIENITNQLEKNKATEYNNYYTDKAQGLENMRIEHEAAVAMTKHNNQVAKINAETKMEQFANFSQGAFTLASIGLQAQAEQQK